MYIFKGVSALLRENLAPAFKKEQTFTLRYAVGDASMYLVSLTQNQQASVDNLSFQSISSYQENRNLSGNCLKIRAKHCSVLLVHIPGYKLALFRFTRSQMLSCIFYE